jgi:hypothetical protein
MLVSAVGRDARVSPTLELQSGCFRRGSFYTNESCFGVVPRPQVVELWAYGGDATIEPGLSSSCLHKQHHSPHCLSGRLK